MKASGMQSLREGLVNMASACSARHKLALGDCLGVLHEDVLEE